MYFVVYREADGSILMLGHDPDPAFVNLQSDPEHGIAARALPDGLFDMDEHVDVNNLSIEAGQITRKDR